MAETPRNNAPKTRGRPFQKGNSGRPRGARHKTSILAERLLQADAEAIVTVITTAARNGDMAAAKIVLDRIYPARRDNPVSLSLPQIATASDVLKAISAILAALAAGELTPTEAGDVVKIVEAFSKAVAVSDLEGRIAALEKKGIEP
jgi:hypothetical protein